MGTDLPDHYQALPQGTTRSEDASLQARANRRGREARRCADRRHEEFDMVLPGHLHSLSGSPDMEALHDERLGFSRSLYQLRYRIGAFQPRMPWASDHVQMKLVSDGSRYAGRKKKARQKMP